MMKEEIRKLLPLAVLTIGRKISRTESLKENSDSWILCAQFMDIKLRKDNRIYN